MHNNQPIGFIDSGVGGLTVVKEALKQLPNENILYVGDTARCPYGPRPEEQVIEYTWEMTRYLMKRNIKMLVIACNTATAVALEEIKEALDIPVVGVILPGTRAALKATKNNKIGIIGTLGTIKSGSYETALKQKAPQTTVTSLACPKFVSIVESNESHSSVAKKIVAETLQSLKHKQLDTLILGCTHYPLLRPIIQNVMGQSVTLIDSGAETVSEVSMLLDYFSIANRPSRQSEKRICDFYTTGSATMFEEIAKSWLDLSTISVSHIELGGTTYASR
ncbi:glutamate racemase [Enterococcus phoeniculicola]|uniref:Glutamate racemase n=1 Tax=Enterococcus phoeniculicola ATCC BAA-412 TaxID=1158610 RepID=R3WWG3_9ENTE|nr:glutamate racemase [Enterococcus phoeniculicola]EOL46120.1 glutamate racemase [Enterococcus phoeniculicola ATCC BAA-412]EOT77035.1 glutamate racemase [Enterococcus phoeniculicola ATCC BAA-412]OJG73374.1 glutamate racemase [Enterococcus phoeniculicola]